MKPSEIIKASVLGWDGSYHSLARESGVDVAAIWRFAQGERGLNLSTLDKLLPVLGLELRPVRRRPSKEKGKRP